MKCTCGGKTQVTSTREHATGSPYRRRVCLVCGEAFHTIEERYENDGGPLAAKPGKAIKKVKPAPAPRARRVKAATPPTATAPVISASRHRIEDMRYDRESKDIYE